MKVNNKTLLLSLMSTFLIGINVYAKPTTYNVNGEKYTFDPSSINLYVNEKLVDNSILNTIIYQNNLYASVRSVFGGLGAEISYDKKTKETTVKYSGKTLVLKTNDDEMYLDGKKIQLNAPIKTIDNRMMAPARALSEPLGLRVDWDKATRTAFIDEVIDPIDAEEQALKALGEEIAQANQEALGQEENVGQEEENPNVEETVNPENETKEGEIKEETKEGEMLEEEPVGEPATEEGANPPAEKEETIEPIDKEEDEGRPVYIIGDTPKINDLSIQTMERTKYVQTNLESYSIKDNVFQLNLENSLSYVSKYISDGTNLVLDIENCTLSDAAAIRKNLNNSLIKSFTIKPIESGTPKVRVIIEMYEGSSFMVSYTVDRKTISIEIESPRATKPKEEKPSEPAAVFEGNVTYDEANSRIALKKIPGRKVSFTHNDLYNKNQYILNLGSDFSDVYADGTYSVENEYVSSFTISSGSGKTEIKVNEYKITACVTEEDSNNYYIYLKSPKEVYPLIVILDPGHGGEDPGAVGNGLREKDLNTDIGYRLYDLINQNSQMKAYFTKTEDYKMPLSERAYFANRNGDIFISIHNNSSTKSTPRGTEVYYYRHYNDSEIGYSSRQLAQVMCNSISEHLGSNNRGTFENAYTVIQKTEVPACLLEIGFLSNWQDAALLGTPEYRQKAAEGAYEGILKVFENYKPAR
ncbi:MAG: N-acetylmuramoyl-L-alanine amidase [Clostridiales bacterium]|nr:N-acetylmuramoyl-L-alanine amidase [Clostridiales bacterium]